MRGTRHGSTTYEIPLSEPLLSGNEWSYVRECIETGWVSSAGAFVKRFEDAVVDYVGAVHAVAVVNGTSALHLSLLGCGVGAGDEVIVPALTFAATANAVRYVGAHPVFMDCEPETLCIDVQKLSDFIHRECARGRDGFLRNGRTGRKVKAVVPVHVFGHPVEMDPLIEVCGDSGVTVVEDAAESLGSFYRGRHTGTFGLAGCFSFNGNKIITAGGGGMVVTDDPELAARMRHLSRQAKSDPFEYDHDDVGYNYALSNIQAAVGLAQMERLDEYVAVKRRNAALYMDLLSGFEEVSFLGARPWVESNCWFYTLKVGVEERTALMGYLMSKGIQVRPLWKPLHLLSVYRDEQAYRIEHALRAHASCFNLPCSVGLGGEEIEFVVRCIRSFYSDGRRRVC